MSPSPSPSLSSSSSPISTAWKDLIEVDELTVKVIVENTYDNISTGIDRDGFQYTSDTRRILQDLGQKKKEDQVTTTPKPTPKEVSDNKKDTHDDDPRHPCHRCQAEHGLSLLLQATTMDGVQQRTILLDAGPYPELWKTNANKMNLDLSSVEAIVLSHYHYDHSGGLPGAVSTIVEQRRKQQEQQEQPLIVDLHPAAIVQRGADNGDDTFVAHIPDNPTTEHLKSLGASINFQDQDHTLADNTFYVSGFVPRQTEYETGFPSHVTMVDGKWKPDPDIADERYVACRVKDRGVVVFSCCSHSGINNVLLDAQSKEYKMTTISKKKEDDSCIFAVVGGFHLSGSAVEDRIERTVEQLKADINPTIVLGGHCTGWRAQSVLARTFPGRFQPMAVGATYSFQSRSFVASCSQ